MNAGAIANTFDAAIRFFLYILIFWLPYSPAVIESCVIVGLILWIVKRGFMAGSHVAFASGKGRIWRYLQTFQPTWSIINVPILFFLAVCLISVVGSVFFEQSFHNFLTKTLEWFIVYFLVIEVFNQKKHIYIALTVFILTSLATALDSIIQFYFTHKDFFLGHIIVPGDRPTAAFKTPNGLGGYLTVAIPAILTVIFLEKIFFRYRLFIALIFLFLLWSLILTFSRGAWLGTFLGGILMLLIFLFHQQKRKFYLSLALLLTTVFLYMFFWFTVAGSFNSDLFARFHTVQWRTDIWRQSIPMIKDGLLIGHGINTFMQLFEIYRTDVGFTPTYAHNCYIQLAVETGIVGLFGFLWIIVDFFRKSITYLDLDWANHYNLTILSVGLLSGIFAFLIHSFFDTNFYSLQLSVYLWFMIGMQVTILKELK